MFFHWAFPFNPNRFPQARSRDPVQAARRRRLGHPLRLLDHPRLRRLRQGHRRHSHSWRKRKAFFRGFPSSHHRCSSAPVTTAAAVGTTTTKINCPLPTSISNFLLLLLRPQLRMRMKVRCNPATGCATAVFREDAVLLYYIFDLRRCTTFSFSFLRLQLPRCLLLHRCHLDARPNLLRRAAAAGTQGQAHAQAQAQAWLTVKVIMRLLPLLLQQQPRVAKGMATGTKGPLLRSPVANRAPTRISTRSSII